MIHTQNQTTIDLFGLPLRGDILVKCFERTKTSERSPLFRCQFNTCTFDLDACQDSLFTLKFTKQQLDDIYKVVN
uniref:C2 tensin-type domain-containing protein n=1 Tax=Syphacia muris TaxID=451379 RepID=A0A0N5AKG5_9BILA